jgi:hypothetical protein
MPEVKLPRYCGIDDGRVLRQVAPGRPRFRIGLSDADDIGVIYLFTTMSLGWLGLGIARIGQEHLSRHWPVDHHRCGHFVMR